MCVCLGVDLGSVVRTSNDQELRKGVAGHCCALEL